MGLVTSNRSLGVLCSALTLCGCTNVVLEPFQFAPEPEWLPIVLDGTGFEEFEGQFVFATTVDPRPPEADRIVDGSFRVFIEGAVQQGEPVQLALFIDVDVDLSCMPGLDPAFFFSAIEPIVEPFQSLFITPEQLQSTDCDWFIPGL